MPDDYDFVAYQKSQRKRVLPQNTPWITYLMIAVSVLLTLCYHLPDDQPSLAFWKKLASIGDPDSRAIWGGHYYLLFTSIFLHGGVLHLLFNLYWLRQLGSLLELSVPTRTYLAFILGAAFVSSGAELGLFGQGGIGLSGVGYALVGVLWAGRGRSEAWRREVNKQTISYFVVWGIFCIATTYMGGQQIANAAHFGGLGFGLSIGWLFFAPRRKPLWAVPLALLSLFAVLSLFYLPWSWRWLSSQAYTAYEAKQYEKAIGLYERAIAWKGDKDFLWSNISAMWFAVGEEKEASGDQAGAVAAYQKATEFGEKADALALEQSRRQSQPREPSLNTLIERKIGKKNETPK